MAFPLPPKSMGPPSSCSGVQFPGTDGRSAHLDAADWLPHAVTSLRLEIGPPHRAARAVLTPPPRNLQRSRDQTARAGSLFNTSECVAAQRLQFVVTEQCHGRSLHQRKGARLENPSTGVPP
nr:uncharacterized protein LOC118968486 isoform X2 [Manis javanica]